MTYFLFILVCLLLLTLIKMWCANRADQAYLKQSHQQSLLNIHERSRGQEIELELLLNAFDDALIVITPKGIIKVANRAANRLCRGRKLRGKSFVSAFLNEPISDAILKALEKNEPTREKIILPHSNFGSETESNIEAWIIDTAPIEMDEEKLLRVILRDVTSEHKTDQIKREFIANASHELRTPLAIINGYLENLLEDNMIEHPTIARRFISTMQKHGNRLSLLIEDMLSISKMESGDAAALNLSEFLIVDLFVDVKERLNPLIENTPSSIEISISDPLLSLYGDRFYWEQILFNLTDNALKQNTDRKIKVTLKAEQNQDSIHLSVTDTGKGISSIHLPYIFNRFYRIEKHHSQNEIKGTGLGLSIVKKAVEAHGGNISVSSIPSVKTTFLVEVPILEKTAETDKIAAK